MKCKCSRFNYKQNSSCHGNLKRQLTRNYEKKKTVEKGAILKKLSVVSELSMFSKYLQVYYGILFFSTVKKKNTYNTFKIIGTL